MHWSGRDIENKNGICLRSYSISMYSNGKSEEERPLGEARNMWGDNIKVVLKIIGFGGGAWTGLIWLRTVTIEELLRTRQRTFGLHDIRGITGLTEELCKKIQIRRRIVSELNTL